MQYDKKTILNQRGFSLVEILLASGLFAMLVLIFAGVLVFGQESTIRAGQRGRAIFLANEGLEAARSIRDQNFNNLTIGNFGLQSNGQWSLVSNSDTNDIFTRTLNIANVDDHTKQITSQVQWTQSGGSVVSVALTTLLTDWQTTPSMGTSTQFCNAN